MNRTRLAAFTALLLVVGVVLAAPASARRQEPIQLRPSQSVVREYSPLIGSSPVQASGNPGNRNPEICADAPYCDVIPLELSVPDSLRTSDTKDYFLRLAVDWDAATGSDLSIYLYKDPYVSGDQAIASAATASVPEKINIYRPEQSKYILLVFSSGGANQGYSVNAALTVEDFGGAPDFGGVDAPPPPSNSSPQADDEPNFAFEPQDDGPTAAPAESFSPADPLPLADVDQDSSLSALARQRGGLAETLAAPRLNVVEKEEEPPAPVGGATVAVLGGLLPASVVGFSLWLLRRRGGAAATGL